MKVNLNNIAEQIIASFVAACLVEIVAQLIQML
jgi:hypothetical protein